MGAVARYFDLAADKTRAAEARKVGEQLIEMARPVPSLLDQFAWKILTREGVAVRDIELARRAVEIANKATGGKDPSVLHTYARLLFETGQKDKAIETEKKAIRIARSDPRYAEAVGELTEQLKRFEGTAP